MEARQSRDSARRGSVRSTTARPEGIAQASEKAALCRVPCSGLRTEDRRRVDSMHPRSNPGRRAGRGPPACAGADVGARPRRGSSSCPLTTARRKPRWSRRSTAASRNCWPAMVRAGEQRRRRGCEGCGVREQPDRACAPPAALTGCCMDRQMPGAPPPHSARVGPCDGRTRARHCGAASEDPTARRPAAMDVRRNAG